MPKELRFSLLVYRATKRRKRDILITLLQVDQYSRACTSNASLGTRDNYWNSVFNSQMKLLSPRGKSFATSRTFVLSTIDVKHVISIYRSATSTLVHAQTISPTRILLSIIMLPHPYSTFPAFLVEHQRTQSDADEPHRSLI